MDGWMASSEWCPEDFDSLLHWPATPAASVAVLPCFAHLNDILYDTTQNATRECDANGRWSARSDYSACRELLRDAEDDDDAAARATHAHAIELTTTIYAGGYALSLIALLVAVYIFCKYKDLRCLRNTIHMNLMISFILVDAVWIATFLLQVLLAQESPLICIALIALLHYFHLTNFFWMFIEGLYLYVLVVKTFRGDMIKLPFCIVVGWLLPAACATVWCVAKAIRLYRKDPHGLVHLKSCPWSHDSLDWIFQAPSIIVLFANVVFLVIIMWVLITKLRSANNAAETQQYQKAAKALLVLIPLLGVTYVLMLVGPSEPGALRRFYECLRAVLLSTQGFAVAVFYCFLNTEVKNTVTHHLNAWHTHRRLSQRPSSQRNRSSRDWSRRSKGDSLRLYQSVNLFKKRASSCSAATTTSLIDRSAQRNHSGSNPLQQQQQPRRATAPTFSVPPSTTTSTSANHSTNIF